MANIVELTVPGGIGGSGGGSGGSASLTTDITANTDCGGVKSGKKYEAGTSIETVIKDMLVKYIAPAITTAIMPSTSPLYVGETVASVKITATVTKKSYSITSVKFYVGSTVVHEVTDSVANGGTFEYTYTPENPISANTSFKASVADGTSTVNGPTRTIAFVNPSYFGTVSDSVVTPTESDIIGTTKMKLSGKSYTNNKITMDYGKILFAYPKSYGALTSIKDANNVQYISSYTRSEVSVNGVAMYCYLLTDAAGVTNFTQIYT